MVSPHGNRWLRWLIAGYTLLMCTVVGGMLWVRQSVFVTYSTPESIADWREWKADVERQQTDPGPVQRRVPKSEEPPALVLMRDYFVVSLGGAVFFTSLLFWIIAWFVTGALSTVDTRPVRSR